MKETDGYLRKKQAAEYLGVSERTLSGWMSKEIVPFRRMSPKVVLFNRSELDRALSRSAVNVVKGGVA